MVQDFLKQKDLGERKVRIITAELINQMNQPEAQTEEFDVLWDRTLDIMEDNNKQILGICSPAVSAFIRDAVLLNCPVFCRSGDFYTDEYAFVVGCPEKKQIYFLSYKLQSDVTLQTFEGAGFDPQAPAEWLYDEFHNAEGTFEHHVIFSDGVSYVIPFTSFYCRTTKWFNEE